MILIVTTPGHQYTHSCLEQERDSVDVRVVTWNDVLNKEPRRASYILTDFDRLAPWTLYEASGFYQEIVKRGFPVLNHPARAASRTGLLRHLHRRGINDFNAYRVEEQVKPRKWPVFLRCEGHHGPPLSGLIDEWDEVQRHILRCMRAGIPISSMLIIEYAAEPVAPGLFRKLSVFRIGERFLGYTCVHDDQWIVKHGKQGIAPLEYYEEEYAFVRDNPFEETVRQVFAASGLEYGRVDFGLVGGKPQFYEVNSNPHLSLRPEGVEIPRRQESFALFTANYLEAMKAIDLPE